MNAVTLTNGGTIPERLIPSLSIEDFRREIIEAFHSGSRIVGLFGQKRGESTVRLRCVMGNDSAGTLSVLDSDVDERYPAITPNCPQAHLFEREIWEQFGIVADGHPWLKPVRFPSAAAVGVIPGDMPFYSVDGEEIHEVAVGPVHAGIIEPGHFRFQCHGETVMHLEIQLGYQARGLESLLEGACPSKANVLAESIAGDTCIGHALAYSQVMEALAGVDVSPRAHGIRGIALEIERVASHIGDLGALCTDVGYLPPAAILGRLRGVFLNLLMEISGNRHGRGLIRPGGVMWDMTDDMQALFLSTIAEAEREFGIAADMMFGAATVRSRFQETGVINARACEALGFVGPAARACGVERDARKDHPLGVYRFEYIPITTADAGDVYARAMVRRIEVERSLEFLKKQIGHLPAGGKNIHTTVGRPGPESFTVSIVEGWRGEIVHAAVTDAAGAIRRYKIKDPSFHNWTALALALRQTPISDFPLCNKSFNLSYAGFDL